MKETMLTIAILTLTGLQPAHAHGVEDHGSQPHEVSTGATTPAMSVQDILAGIQASLGIVGSNVDAGQFDLIHAEIEKIGIAVKSLKTGATIADDKKARFESSINQLMAQLERLHTAADAKHAEKSRTEFKKTQGAFKLVEINLK